MEIQISYSKNSKLTEEEINEVIELAKRHGNVQIKGFGIRAGIVDLNTLLEFTFFTILAKPFFEGLSDGLFGKDYFRNLGVDTIEHINLVSNYLAYSYREFISKKQNEKYAISIVEHINDVIYYAVLNHNKSTEKLIENVSAALVRAIGEISLKRIPIEEPNVVQLYPNFETESWDYLFIPTINGYQKFIDRYYDFNLNQIININTRDEFYKLFNTEDEDINKFIISAKYHEKKG